MSPTELRASALGVDLDGMTILDEVDLAVAAGQMLAVVGASGSGKTTLAHALAGLIAPDRGEVTLAGVSLDAPTPLAERPALVPQDFGLVSTLTAAETVSLPLQVRACPPAEIRDRAARWLGALGLDASAARTVTELSGGQRQRVAIARALAMRAAAIVMDEPTAELDRANRDLVLGLLDAELGRGAAIVIVSHDPEVIAHADLVYELRVPRGGGVR